EARSHGYVCQIELTYRAVQAGFRVVEIPITFRDRAQGRSKMSWRIALEAVVLVPRLRWGRRGRALAVHMRGVSHMRGPGRRPTAAPADDRRSMRLNDLALVQGSAATRATLRRWEAA